MLSNCSNKLQICLALEVKWCHREKKIWEKKRSHFENKWSILEKLLSED